MKIPVFTLCHRLGPGLILVALGFSLPLQAMDEFPYDLRLVRALIRIEMMDYAARQLELMLIRYPAQKEALQLEQGRLLLLTGKSTPAEALLNQIKPGSPVFIASRLLLAEAAARRGDNAGAKKAYAQYFAQNTGPASEDESDVEEFRKAVIAYSQILKNDGDGAGAAKIMEYLAKIKGEGGTTERQLKFLKGKTILDAMDEAAGAGKPVDTKAVADAIAMLESIQFGGMDAITAASLVELAHGYNLIQDYGKAMEILRAGAEIMDQVEDILKEERNLNASPLAGALLYYGMAQVGLARQELKHNDRGKAEKNLIEALKRFQKVRQLYPQSPCTTRATFEFANAKTLMEKEFNRKISLVGGDKDGEIEIKLQQADALLKNKKPAEALPLYLDAARAGRRSSRFPEVAMRLVECYSSLDKLWEAETLGDYLAQAFPGSAETADTLLRLGAQINQKAKARKEKTAQEAMIAEALSVWDRFVTVAPGHARAADIAFMIAENDYRLASEQVAAIKSMPEGEAKEQAKAKARDYYLAADPKYERVIQLFPAHEKGLRSLYKQGWIRYSTGGGIKAAEAFLKYSDVESNPQMNDDILEAKFRGAEQQMLNGAAPEAVQQYQELLAWLQPANPRGINPESPAAKRIREDATSYLGWAYDLVGESVRPQLDELDEKIAAVNKRIREIVAEQQRLADQAAHAAADLKKAEADFADMEKALNAGVGGGAVVAGEATEGMSAEEKAMAKAKAEEQRGRMIRDGAKREIGRMAQEKIELESERDNLLKTKVSNSERMATFKTRIARLGSELKILRESEQQESADQEKTAKAIAEATAAAAKAEEEVAKYQKALEAAKSAQVTAKDAQERQAATTARAQAAEALQAAELHLRQVNNETGEQYREKKQEQLNRITDNLAKLKPQIAERETQLSPVERELELAAKDQEILDCRLVVAAKGLERNTLAVKILETVLGGGSADNPEYRKAVEAELLAWKAVLAKRAEKTGLIQDQVNQAMAELGKEVATLQTVIQQTEAEKTPIRQKQMEWKQKAQAQFAQFLKEYPNSRQVPDNMARLGTFFLESQQYEEAAKLLNDLAVKYPESKAGKQALFNLGRAQFETGRKEPAAAAFEKILQRAGEQTPANLHFISDKMLMAGYPKLALAAAQELLARSDDKKNPDAVYIFEKLRESALYRAGCATAQLEDYPRALDYFRQLLKEKPNTAYFFDAKLQLGEVKRKMKPADLAGAVDEFNEILQYTTDPVLNHQALCEVGETFAAMGGRENLKTAAARFQQVVLLADRRVAANLPFIEKAMVESARLFARLGENESRDKMVAKYREIFPGGKRADELNRLPPAEFTPEPAATPGVEPEPDKK